MLEQHKEFECEEYLQEYYSLGLFHATECQLLYSHKDMVVDNEKDFLRIGGVFDDHDLSLGYRKNQKGIWGHNNRHDDGNFYFVSNSLKELCEGWYKKNIKYWFSIDSQNQWLEISNYLTINILNYGWNGVQMVKFVDFCINNNHLSNYFIKAYKTIIGITITNGFSSRSKTNMVYLDYDHNKERFLVHFKTDFFDYNHKTEEYNFDNLNRAIEDIKGWMKNSV